MNDTQDLEAKREWAKSLAETWVVNRLQPRGHLNLAEVFLGDLSRAELEEAEIRRSIRQEAHKAAAVALRPHIDPDKPVRVVPTNAEHKVWTAGYMDGSCDREGRLRNVMERAERAEAERDEARSDLTHEIEHGASRRASIARERDAALERERQALAKLAEVKAAGTIAANACFNIMQRRELREEDHDALQAASNTWDHYVRGIDRPVDRRHVLATESEAGDG